MPKLPPSTKTPCGEFGDEGEILDLDCLIKEFEGGTGLRCRFQDEGEASNDPVSFCGSNADQKMSLATSILSQDTGILGGKENIIQLADRLTEGRRSEAKLEDHEIVNSMPAIDCGKYPVAEEAAEELVLHIWVFIRETLVQFFLPFSIPFVWITQGRRGMEMHGWGCCGGQDSTQGDITNAVSFFSSAVGSVGAMSARQIIFICIVSVPMFVTLGLAIAGIIPRDSPFIVDVMLGASLEFLGAMARGLKYGYRKKCEPAQIRIMDHASRRHEELAMWVMMAEDWAVYLTRLAASQVGLDLATPCILYRSTHSARASATYDPDALKSSKTSIEETQDLDNMPFFKYTEQVAPSVMKRVFRRADGSVEAPVAAILLELVIPLCANRITGSEKAKPVKEILGSTGTAVLKLERRTALFIGLLPTLFRVSFLRNTSDALPSHPGEWLAAFQCLFSLGFTSTFFVGMIFHSCAITFKRRLHLIKGVCALLTGGCFAGGRWRLSLDYSQANLWNKLRKFVLVWGESFERRAVGNLVVFFSTVVAVKLSVLLLFLNTALTSEKVSIKDFPVIFGILAALPFLFAPGIVHSLSQGAELNFHGPRSFNLAIIDRRKQLVDAQAVLCERSTKQLDRACAGLGCSLGIGEGEDEDEETTADSSEGAERGGAAGAPTSPSAALDMVAAVDEESRIKQLELVDSYFEHIFGEVEEMKPYVLLGHGGEGLFELNYSLALQYMSESILNIAFLSQIVTFD